MKLLSRCQLGLQSSDWGWRICFLRAHSCSWHIHAGVGRRLRFLTKGASLWGWWSILTTQLLASGEIKAEAATSFMT